MEPIYFQELCYYDKSKILNDINNDEKAFDKLQKCAIINNVEGRYQFKYVGVIIIDELIIYCYPKYITNTENIENDFKQVINVIKKYNNLHEEIDYQNEEIDDVSFNYLSMAVFFLEDYYENGVYNNIKNILEINGNGEIDWNRTINYTNPIIEDNMPYYIELYTKYNVDDIYDYFKLLHEYIITVCSKTLEKIGLLDLLNLIPVELSDKKQDDFGELKTILNNLENELNIQFNSHKQKLLKSMHTFLQEKNSFSNENYLTVYGTSTYHVIWEEMCSKVFRNKLYSPLKYLNLNSISSSSIMGSIKKPKWILNSGKHHNAPKSFEPDIITFDKDTFYILDAKYYKLKFDEDSLDGQPGLEDITKQYLYQLALEDFRINHGFGDVKNAFLFPKYDGEIENKGYVKLDILSNLGLEDIQVIMLPACKINKMYLNNKKMDISMLDL